MKTTENNDSVNATNAKRKRPLSTLNVGLARRQIGCLFAVTIVCCLHFLIALGIVLYHGEAAGPVAHLYLVVPLLIPFGAALYPFPKPISSLLGCLAYLLTILCLFSALFSRRRSTFRLSVVVLIIVLLFCLHGCYRYGEVYFRQTGL